jgi:hypothetical protein
MDTFTPKLNFRALYDRFDAPVTAVDCGVMCAPHNPSGKPFCCDLCHAVPAAYHAEWAYLREATDLWQAYTGSDCPDGRTEATDLREKTPPHMTLLACNGPALCQRDFRSMSCRQFPFIPYISSDDRFLGLAYEWLFEPVCWVISNLNRVTPAFREAFVRVYDELLAVWPDEYESYYANSEEMREHFAAQKRAITLLHRNGGFYLVSPVSERMRRVSPECFPRFGPYRIKSAAAGG